MDRKNSLKQFCTALKNHDHFMLSCHVTPEGDAIGSILAVDSLLRRLGKKTTVVCADPFPERLSILSSRRWKRVDEIKQSAKSFKALVLTDCPTLDRIGSVQELITPETAIFNIDHHVSNLQYGKYNYVRPDAAACGEVVFDIFKYFKLPLTREEAKNLYVAISTDTGSFKYSSTTIHCHRIAAELISTGIDVEKISEELYATYSLNKINLYSRLLGRVKTTQHGHVAWVGMTQEDLKRSGATAEDAEGFIDFLKYLKEVKVAFFMSETEPKTRIRVSFRAKGNYDVNGIATHFEGGGHKKAAGCIMHAVLQDAEQLILKQIKKIYPAL